MSIADLNSLYTAAVSALDAGDYDAAITKALAVKVRLATTPNLMRIVAAGQQHMTWTNAEAIDGFITNCRLLKAQQLAARGGPYQQTKVNYTREESCDGYQ